MTVIILKKNSGKKLSNNLTFTPLGTRKRKKTKPKVSRRKEIIKREKINNRDPKKTEGKDQ